MDPVGLSSLRRLHCGPFQRSPHDQIRNRSFPLLLGLLLLARIIILDQAGSRLYLLPTIVLFLRLGILVHCSPLEKRLSAAPYLLLAHIVLHLALLLPNLPQCRDHTHLLPALRHRVTVSSQAEGEVMLGVGVEEVPRALLRFRMTESRRRSQFRAIRS